MDNLPENLKKIIIQVKEFIQNNQYFNQNYSIVAFVLFLIYYIVFDKAIELITFIISLAYPGYMSFKSLQKEDNKNNLKKWNIYWIFFAAINLFEKIAWLILNFIPMYYLIKLIFIVWLFNLSYQDINNIYQNSILSLLIKNQIYIDNYLNIIYEKTNKLRLDCVNLLLNNKRDNDLIDKKKDDDLTDKKKDNDMTDKKKDLAKQKNNKD